MMIDGYNNEGHWPDGNQARNRPNSEKEPLESMQNQSRNQETNEIEEERMDTTTHGDEITRALFTMELALDPEFNEAHVIMIMYAKIEQTLYKWIENDEIEGI